MRNQALTSAEIEKIIEAYRNGMTAKEAGAQVGCGKTAALSTLAKNGVALRPISSRQPARKYHFRQDIFNVIDTEEKAYWLGFIAADGTISKGILSFGLHTQDTAHLRKFAAFIGSAAPVTEHIFDYDQCAPRQCARFNACSAQLVRDLATLGVGERKSHTAQAWSGPPHLLRHYWRGVFDGDGGFSAKGKDRWQGVLVGSDSMMESFLNYCLTLVSTKATVRPHASIYRVVLCDRALATVIGELYRGANVSLSRKDEVAKLIIERYASNT